MKYFSDEIQILTARVYS